MFLHSFFSPFSIGVYRMNIDILFCITKRQLVEDWESVTVRQGICSTEVDDEEE